MIPLRATNYKLAESWPKYIIIHHTAEFVRDVPKFSLDNPKFQSDEYIDYSYKILHQLETRYHFIVEWVKTDYQTIVSQPLTTICDYPDLAEEYKTAIHIALMGNYDIDLPTNRMYKVLAYRLLAPLLRMYYLDESAILFHGGISQESNLTCPGEYVDKTKILNELNSIYRRRPLRRS